MQLPTNSYDENRFFQAAPIRSKKVKKIFTSNV